MMFNTAYIDYEIRPDGTCSYCGNDAGFTELPDGDLVTAVSCYFCDEFNIESQMEAIEDLVDECDWSDDADG